MKNHISTQWHSDGNFFMRQRRRRKRGKNSLSWEVKNLVDERKKSHDQLLGVIVRRTRRHHFFKSSSRARYSTEQTTDIGEPNFPGGGQYIPLTNISFLRNTNTTRIMNIKLLSKDHFITRVSNPSPIFKPSFLPSLNWTTNERALPVDFRLVIISFTKRLWSYYIPLLQLHEFTKTEYTKKTKTAGARLKVEARG